MGHVEFGWGNNSDLDSSKSQFELRSSWQVADTSAHFSRLFHVSLLGFVIRVVKLFKSPQSTGFLFEFGPGMRDQFARLVDARAFPPKTWQESLSAKFIPEIVAPDNPGPTDRDAWWRGLAAGAAIGASFRERGTDTSLHIAFNSMLCDVHVDRNGFVTGEGGYTHWNLNGLLRHLTMDLAGDKVPWLLGSLTYVGKHNRPLLQATLAPWLAVELPGQDGADKAGIKVGLQVVGRF